MAGIETTFNKSQGFTLMELMITVAIIGIISAIAIPTYTGYLNTTRQAAAEQNLQQLRVFLENYFLDNDTYIAGTYDPNGADTLTGPLGWRPDGDEDKFVYTVAACGAGTIANCYKITVNGFDNEVTAEYEKAP